MGWMPSPAGELRTHLPPLPTEYLQEKHVLKDFVYRVNTIGVSLFENLNSLGRPHDACTRTLRCVVNYFIVYNTLLRRLQLHVSHSYNNPRPTL